MIPTTEQLARWNDRLENDAAMLAAAGDPSLNQWKSWNRNAALAGVYLAELLGDRPDAEQLVRAFGFRHVFSRHLETLLDKAAAFAAKHQGTTT